MCSGIERVEFSSLDALKETFVGRSEPVLISRSVGEQIRAAHWSPASLSESIGSQTVTVLRAEAGRFDYDVRGERNYDAVRVPFAEALETIESSQGSDRLYYLRQLRLEDVGLQPFGLLGSQLLPPKISPVVPRLWISSAGCVTPLHYDGKNNLLTQMHGRKRVTLVPATEYENVYPYGAGHYATHASRADAEAVDFDAFPNFPAERLLSFDLAPGDTLFIPAFWWHHVRTLELSVSVNEWWPARGEQYMVAAAADYVRLRYQRNRLAQLFPNEGRLLRPIRLARLAEQAAGKNLLCAATLLCGAACGAALEALALGAGEASATEVSGSERASLAPSLAARGVISEREVRQTQLCLSLADLAAAHGKTQKLSDVREMVSKVSAFVSRHLPTSDEHHDNASRATM